MDKSYAHEASVLARGEAYYLEHLKDKLLADYKGCYLAIDVDTNDYLINSSRAKVIELAQERFDHKTFYLVQIGNLSEPTTNFRARHNVKWLFS